MAIRIQGPLAAGVMMAATAWGGAADPAAAQSWSCNSGTYVCQFNASGTLLSPQVASFTNGENEKLAVNGTIGNVTVSYPTAVAVPTPGIGLTGWAPPPPAMARPIPIPAATGRP